MLDMDVLPITHSTGWYTSIMKGFSVLGFDLDTENDFCPTDRLIPFNNKKAVSDNLFFKVSLNCPQIMSQYLK